VYSNLHYLANMDKITFTRAQLYDLVWSEPVSAISKKYNISDLSLRGVCKKMNIPLPPNGYWSKIRAGKKVPVTCLPVIEGDKQEIIFSLRQEEDLEKDDFQSPLSILEKEIENDPDLPTTLSKLKDPDKLVISAKSHLEAQKFGKYGSANDPVFCRYDNLYIRVTPAQINRALCFMDSFIKLFRARGHKVEVDYGSFVIIENEKMGISINEIMKKRKVTPRDPFWHDTEFFPTGILSFKVREESYRYFIWKDGKLPLEKQLVNILAVLELRVKEKKAEEITREAERKIEREKERVRIEVRERKEKELSDFLALMKKADRWNRAMDLRKYLDALEEKANEENNTSEEFTSWLTWARKKNDWLDPLVEAEDNLLNWVNKETLDV
jgi:hypothetical protein